MVGLLGLTPGTIFAGEYEIRRILAKGGMGGVYLAFDRARGEEIALKVLLPELVSDERMRTRFTREARVASEIPSPYVPRVHATGIDESGMPFIAMELLRGRDLRQHIEDHGALSVEAARPILEQVGHALAAAHQSGLVHRDLKAENVFLHEAPGQMQVKLLDFGVVKVIDGHRTSATGTGAVGSPLWMAPEQTSAGGRIAPATDSWGYGLLAFYLLTGGFYWKAAFDDSGVAGLLREMHVDPIEPPSRRAAVVAPGVRLPPGFDAWFLRAMERDSTRRHRDGAAAWAALEPVLAAGARPVDRSPVAFAETLTFAPGDPELEGARTGPLVAVAPSTDTWIDHSAGSGAEGGTIRGLGEATPVPAAAPPRAETPTPSSAGSWGAPPVAWAERASSRASSRGAPPVGPPVAWAERASSQAPSPGSDRAPAPAPPPWRPPPVEPEVIPTTDPPPPSAPPASGSRWIWVLGFLAVGIAVSALSAVIVWVFLTVTDTTGPPRPRPPRPVAVQPVG